MKARQRALALVACLSALMPEAALVRGLRAAPTPAAAAFVEAAGSLVGVRGSERRLEREGELAAMAADAFASLEDAGAEARDVIDVLYATALALPKRRGDDGWLPSEERFDAARPAFPPSLEGSIARALERIGAAELSAVETTRAAYAVRRLGLSVPRIDVDSVVLGLSRYEVPQATAIEQAAAQVLSAEAALQLPFRFLPNLVAPPASLEDLAEEVGFQRDHLITRSGVRVLERRLTRWLAEDGIGGLAYSGKIMPPAPLGRGGHVAAVRDQLLSACNLRFDCCLANLYADEKAACKWHTDPEHGSMWALDTVVVSVGDTRRFALRKLGDASTDPASGTIHHFHAFEGDAVWMHSDCQDAFEHAVLPPEGAENQMPRASLVFKRALTSSSGRRGHGTAKAKAARRAPPPAKGRPAGKGGAGRGGGAGAGRGAARRGAAAKGAGGRRPGAKGGASRRGRRGP